MATVDTQAYDIPALDFYHIPFESDLPHDILEVRQTLLTRLRRSLIRVCVLFLFLLVPLPLSPRLLPSLSLSPPSFFCLDLHWWLLSVDETCQTQ